MNDNLRYISLQYIKGDNYEDIASFKDNIKWVLIKLKDKDELDNTEAVEVLYTRLKEAREEKNKKIGESFLDDLINYSSFNLYKKDLKEAKEKAEEKIKEVKEEVKDNDTQYKKIIGDLKKKNADLDTIKPNIENYQFKILQTITKDCKKLLDYVKKEVTDFKTKILDPTKLGELNTKIGELNTKIGELNNIEGLDALKDKIVEFNGKIDEIKAKIGEIKDTYNQSQKDTENFEKAQLLFNNIEYTLDASQKSFEITKNNLAKIKVLNEKSAQIEQKKKEVLDLLKFLQDNVMIKPYERLTKLIALYSSYLNICTKNILKYDRLFEHNEISNIDDAFMIRSYSDFLKKLNKLKENLETKDENKIMRALMNSLEKLFNMYGINTNNEAAMKAFLENVVDGDTNKGKAGPGGKQSKEVDYIIERIINYNLNM